MLGRLRRAVHRAHLDVVAAAAAAAAVGERGAPLLRPAALLRRTQAVLVLADAHARRHPPPEPEPVLPVCKRGGHEPQTIDAVVADVHKAHDRLAQRNEQRRDAERGRRAVRAPRAAPVHEAAPHEQARHVQQRERTVADVHHRVRQIEHLDVVRRHEIDKEQARLNQHKRAKQPKDEAALQLRREQQHQELDVRGMRQQRGQRLRENEKDHLHSRPVAIARQAVRHVREHVRPAVRELIELPQLHAQRRPMVHDIHDRRHELQHKVERVEREVVRGRKALVQR